MSTKKIGLFYAGCSALCWSVLAIVLKYALTFANTGSIVWIRMLIASSCIILFFAFKKTHQLKILWEAPRWAVISALCLAVNYFSFTKGIEMTTASNAEIMIQLGPVLLILAGVFYFKETLSWIQWGGIFLALCGFSLFYWEQIGFAYEKAHIYFYGNLWVYFSAVTWALFAIFQKKLSFFYSPQQLNMLTYTVCAIALSITADFNVLKSLSAHEWMILTFLGLNTLVAYGCLAEALKKAPAVEVSFIIVLNPLLTIFFIQLMYFLKINIIEHEPLDWRGYLGALLVVFGISCALLLKKRSRLKPYQRFLLED